MVLILSPTCARIKVTPWLRRGAVLSGLLLDLEGMVAHSLTKSLGLHSSWLCPRWPVARSAPAHSAQPRPEDKWVQCTIHGQTRKDSVQTSCNMFPGMRSKENRVSYRLSRHAGISNGQVAEASAFDIRGEQWVEEVPRSAPRRILVGGPCELLEH